MESEVILMQDVPGLGAQGDVRRVAPGYARNYLFPRKLAAPATPKYVKMLEEARVRREAEARREAERMRAEADRLSQLSCTISMHAGEDGKLFGAVTAADIAEGIGQLGFAVDKRQVELAEPIKDLGVFTVDVRLHAETVARVKVWVVQK
ncbi:MAG: 50S ribosomal protein L9 [bacterium]|nr:50S ribosomal protein L9 [bacterium]